MFELIEWHKAHSNSTNYSAKGAHPDMHMFVFFLSLYAFPSKGALGYKAVVQLMKPGEHRILHGKMKTGAPRVCATGRNPTHYRISDLWHSCVEE